MGTLIWVLLYALLGAANALLWSGFAANAVLHAQGRLGAGALWGWLVMVALGLLAVPLLIAVRVGQARARKNQSPQLLRALFQSGFWLELVFLSLFAVIS